MTFILNLHGIGMPSRPFEDGEEQVWISRSQFTQVLDQVEQSAAHIAITFDDGNESDFEIAVPELRKRGIAATFFVLAGKLDGPGYLTSEQVQEIDADALFTIGSHGMDHRPWPELSDEELSRELIISRDLLSELCQAPVTQAGIPFGSYNARILRRLRETGYSKVFSSDGGPRLAVSANPIPRLSLRQDVDPVALAATISRYGTTKRFANEARAILKGFR